MNILQHTIAGLVDSKPEIGLETFVPCSLQIIYFDITSDNRPF